MRRNSCKAFIVSILLLSAFRGAGCASIDPPKPSVEPAVRLALSGAARAAKATSAITGEELEGVWLTADGSSKVRFEACGAARCARLVWLREPTDPSTGAPWRDVNNEERGLQTRPLIGLSIISNLKFDGDGVWSGVLYDPSDGKSYQGTIQRLGESKIRLSGCVLRVLCKDEIWTKSQ
jgi:uncharacterized protein (DUF2147 family)